MKRTLLLLTLGLIGASLIAQTPAAKPAGATPGKQTEKAIAPSDSLKPAATGAVTAKNVPAPAPVDITVVRPENPISFVWQPQTVAPKTTDNKKILEKIKKSNKALY